MCPRKASAGRLTLAVEATQKMFWQRFLELQQQSTVQALAVHSEIEVLAIGSKNARFYGRFLPLLMNSAQIFAEAYRRYFKLALANPQECKPSPDEWACIQLRESMGVAFDWLSNWWVLACDGENQHVRLAASVPFVPGENVSVSSPTILTSDSQPRTWWCAPCWTFVVYPPGINALRKEHMPDTTSDEKLSPAHTRLILKAMRRIFLMKLRMDMDRGRNEEIIAAGTIPTYATLTAKRKPNKRAGWEERLKLYEVIRKILDAKPDLQGIEFCAELDKRHAQPLHDWVEREEWRDGLTWKEAWQISGLKRKIRRVRQEALKNC
jgi:hypothetical protein